MPELKEDTKKYTPILPFDHTLSENFSMYQSLPYTRDITLITEHSIRLESGNVYKYYRATQQDSYPVGGDR